MERMENFCQQLGALFICWCALVNIAHAQQGTYPTANNISLQSEELFQGDIATSETWIPPASEEEMNPQPDSNTFRTRRDIRSLFRFPFHRPNNVPKSPTAQANCITCQSQLGASCMNAVCCSNLACVGGICSRPGCLTLGAACAFGANQCCRGLNADCLANPATLTGFLCQQCIPQSQACNPLVGPGFVGSCCFGTRCINSVCTPAVTG